MAFIILSSVYSFLFVNIWKVFLLLCYYCCHKFHILLLRYYQPRWREGTKREWKEKKKKDREKANGVTESPLLLTIKQPSAVVIAAKFHSIIPSFFPFAQSSRVESSQACFWTEKNTLSCSLVASRLRLAERKKLRFWTQTFTSLASSSSSSSRKEAGHDPPIFLPSLADGSHFPTMMSRFLLFVA